MNIQIIKHNVFGLALVSATLSSANAITIDNTMISMIMVDKNHGNKVFVKTSTPHGKGTPTCHTSEWDFVFQVDDQTDKNILTLLIAAQNTQRPVSLFGTGTCISRPDVENLQRVEAR